MGSIFGGIIQTSFFPRVASDVIEVTLKLPMAPTRKQRTNHQIVEERPNCKRRVQENTSKVDQINCF